MASEPHESDRAHPHRGDTEPPEGRTTSAGEVTIRAGAASDRAGVIELLVDQMGWPPDSADEWFAWKHEEGPAGPSPLWIAEIEGELAGARLFMPAMWTSPDGEPVLGVRAVDTITHPRARGRGVFRTLTLGALDELAARGVQFVYNTPNDQSRPGYLKMGWQLVDRLDVWMRPSSPRTVPALRHARRPAELASVPIHQVGVAAATFFEGQVPTASATGRWTIEKSPEYLAWRYGLDRLAYRVVPTADGRGALVVRARRRGPCLELAVCDVVGDAAPSALRRAVRDALRAAGADYAISLGALGRELGFAKIPSFGPLPAVGPTLVWRPTGTGGARVPSADSVRVTLGDIELM